MSRTTARRPGCFERGKEEKDARLLDEVCRAFPVARVVPDALLALGSLHESARRWTEAAHAYKRLLLIAPGRRLAGPRRSGGWRTCTKRGSCSCRPGTATSSCRRGFPSVTLERTRRQGTVAELVAAELARPPYAQLIADRPLPPTPVPLWYAAGTGRPPAASRSG